MMISIDDIKLGQMYYSRNRVIFFPEMKKAFPINNISFLVLRVIHFEITERPFCLEVLCEGMVGHIDLYGIELESYV